MRWDDLSLMKTKFQVPRTRKQRVWWDFALGTVMGVEGGQGVEDEVATVVVVDENEVPMGTTYTREGR